MKDKRWTFNILDNKQQKSTPVKAIVHTKTNDEAPKELSDKDLEKLSAILGAINDKNLDAVVEFFKGIKPAKKDDEEGDGKDEPDAGKKAAKDEGFDISEFDVGSDEGDADDAGEGDNGEEVISTDGKDSVMHDSKKSYGSLLKRTTDSKPAEEDLDTKWQKYYDKRNKEE